MRAFESRAEPAGKERAMTPDATAPRSKQQKKAKDSAHREHREKGHDVAVEDSFPASDPPANTGIVGPRSDAPRKASHRRDDEERPTGTPTSDRHAAETAHSWEDEGDPPAR